MIYMQLKGGTDSVVPDALLGADRVLVAHEELSNSHLLATALSIILRIVVHELPHKYRRFECPLTVVGFDGETTITLHHRSCLHDWLRQGHDASITSTMLCFLNNRSSRNAHTCTTQV